MVLKKRTIVSMISVTAPFRLAQFWPGGDCRRKGGLRRGFTLVELLIVVVLLILLMALAVPVLAKLRTSSKAINCTNNLRTLGSAMRLYIAEMNNVLVTRRGGDRGAYVDIWGAELSGRGYLFEPARKDGHRSYTGQDPLAVRCPDGRVPDTISSENWAWYSYGLNIFTPGFRDRTVDGTPISERNILAIGEPGKFVLLADSMDVNGSQGFRLRSGYAGFALRHNGKGNVIFLDGHGEAVDGAEAEKIGFPAIYK